MSQTTTSQLLVALNAEYAALLNFVALLECERGMLVENLGDPLLEHSKHKSNEVLGLNILAQDRLALLQKLVPKTSFNSFQAWLESHLPEGWALWQKILTMAKKSQLLNRANGELIQLKLRHNQQSLAILSKATNKANLYGPDGQSNIASGSGRSLGSG